MSLFARILARARDASLRTKLTAVFTLLVGLVAVSVFVYVPQKIEERAVAAIGEKVESIASMTAYSIGAALFFDDVEAMNQVLLSTRQNKDIVYIVVTNSTGAIVTAFNRELAEKRKFRRTLTRNRLARTDLLYKTVTSVTKNEQEIGKLYLGVSLQELREEVAASRRAIFLLGDLIFGIGIFILFGISTIFTRPLSQITETVERIARGELSERTAVHAHDEAGILAAAFNNMLDNLEAAQRELREANQTLEKRASELKREVSVRRRAQVALRRSERRNRVLFHNTPDPVFIYDKETKKFIDCNKAVFRVYNYSKNELKAMTPFDLHPQHEHEKVRANIDVKNLGSPITYTHVTGNGRQMDVEIISDEVDYEGRAAWISIVRDVTERKRAERALREFAAKLEQSNRALQDFAFVASHDLQEPLRKVQAFGDRLKVKCGDALNEQGRDYLERMQNAASRMQTLINDLLTYSRVTTKAKPFAEVDLSKVTREVLSDLEVRVEELGGRIEMNEMPIIEAEPLQMRQLLQNLIGNALKFHKPDEPPVVRVRGEISSDDGEAAEGDEEKVCHITVSDNGIGFEEKYADRIFGVFQRLHGRDEYQGTGVGLAVCRKIVEYHGGVIQTHSAPGKGTTFVIRLPLAQS